MRISLIALTLIVACGCSSKKSFDASRLSVEWEFVKNDYDRKNNFLAALTFTNGSDGDMPADGDIFFSLRYHGKDLTSNDGAIEHINGDLFTVSGFDLPSRSSKRIEFSGTRK